MSNKILDPLEQFLHEVKETPDGLVLMYKGFNQKTYSYTHDVLTTLSVVQSLKIKIKYKGVKYFITNLSQHVTHEKYTVGMLGQKISASYLTGPAKTALNVILEEVR